MAVVADREAVAPEAEAWTAKVTLTPGTGSPEASVTTTTSAVLKSALTIVDWFEPWT